MKHLKLYEQEEHIVHRRDNGTISYEAWYKDDKLHRLDGPSSIFYYKNGNVNYAVWYENDTRHRLDGPAVINYYPDGSVQYEAWWQNDRHHRLDGPSEILYNEDGTVNQETWYYLGEEMPVTNQEEFDALVELKKLGLI